MLNQPQLAGFVIVRGNGKYRINGQLVHILDTVQDALRVGTAEPHQHGHAPGIDRGDAPHNVLTLRLRHGRVLTSGAQGQQIVHLVLDEILHKILQTLEIHFPFHGERRDNSNT